MPISEEIEKRTSREVAMGSVYAVLERLEQKEFVSAFWHGTADER